MSSRPRTMGAGLAGSSNYSVNVNLNTAGGSGRKQGIPSSVGLSHWSNLAVRTNAYGSIKGRNMIFCVNQLGGVGAGRSQFNVGNSFARPDGVRCRSYSFKL
jgi:hypothetical protein